MRRAAMLLRPIARQAMAFAAHSEPAACNTVTAAWPVSAAMQSRFFHTPAEFRARVCDEKPATLEVELFTGDVVQGPEQSDIAFFLLKLGGFYSKESQQMRGSKRLYDRVVENSESPELRAALDLPQTFAATHSLLCLHIWLLLVRLKLEGEDGAELAQILYEGFQDDVELRVHAEGVKVRVSKWLKELEKGFYGACESYEKALKGDDVMVEALLRNVYGNDQAQRQTADTLARYIAREMACLKLTPGSAIMAGKIKFSSDLL